MLKESKEIDSSQSKISKKQAPKQKKIDDKLLAVWESGNEQLYITLLYENFAERLRKHFVSRTAPEYHERFEDFLQEAILNFHIRIKKPQNQDASTREPMDHFAYLRKAIWNVYLGDYKKQKKSPTKSLNGSNGRRGRQETQDIQDDEIISPSAQDQLDLGVFLREVSASIDELKEPYRAVMRLIRDEDLSEEEIALRLKRPQKIIKTWINRGRDLLKAKHPERLEYLQLRRGKEAR